MTDITFICTGSGGRGTHDPAIPQRQETPQQQGRRHRSSTTPFLTCPACGRQAKLGHHVMQKLAAAGLQQVDISKLPF